MRRRVRGPIAVASLLLVLLAAAPSQAAPHKFHFPTPEIVFVRIDLGSSDGYRLEVKGTRVHYSAAQEEQFSQPGREPIKKKPGPLTYSTLFLTLKRGTSSAEYIPGGATIGGGDIGADLGKLGAVSLHFVPRQVTHRAPEKGCVGADYRIEHGVFEGVLRFDGEGGYTRLLRRRVRGTLTREPAGSCDLTPTKAREPSGTRVGGSRLHGGHGIAFQAKRLSRAGAASFQAFDSEQRGRVAIQRTVSAKGPAGSVLIDDGLTSATVRPPAPFEGEAEFKAFAGKQSGTFLGPLSVSFPGAPDVRLAGKAFEGSLLTGDQCSGDPGITCIGFSG